MPGSSPTMARRAPTRRLNRVDLPTLGRPTIAMREACGISVSGLIRKAGEVARHIRTSYYIDSVPAGSQPAISAPDFLKTNPSLNQFFGPGGMLSRTHPAYEFRRGQLQMAQAVEQALGERRHLIVEAGTGTGKTLAYLLPVIRSGKRVIVSTGTKNLQEQLFHKDVPFIEQALFPEGNRKLSVCYMKGRNNYLCRKKLYDLTGQ